MLDPGTQSEIQGDNGTFVDSCDADGNLVEFTCETFRVCQTSGICPLFACTEGGLPCECPSPPPSGCTTGGVLHTGEVVRRSVECAYGCLDGACLPPEGGTPGAIPCGGAVCDATHEACAASSYSGFVECRPSSAHGCTGGCIVVACDGSDDCSAGEVCVHDVGENNYFRCSAPRGNGLVCSEASDCPSDFPYCVPVAGPPLEPLLGWTPRYCSANPSP